jgi:plastocyanin
MRKVFGILAAVSVLAFLASPLRAADGPVTIVMPNAASIVGAAPFFSDVRVFNTSYSDGVDVMATYRCFLGVCPATAPQFLISLSPRQSMALNDICISAFGAPNSAGGVEFDYTGESEQVVVTSRLYSTAPVPTVGMFIPGLELSEAHADTALTSLRNGGSGGGFRTNAGAFNAGGTAVTATFHVFNGSTPVGNALTRTVPAHSGVQINQIFREAGVADLQTDNGVVTVTATGPVFSYAVVLDNDTTDPVFVRGAEDEPFQAVTPAPTTTHVVHVGEGGNRFVDDESGGAITTILAGDTVTWVWDGSTAHGIASGACLPGSGGPYGYDPTCNADGTFAAAASAAPFSFSRTFPEAGSFPYFCTIHDAGMTGRVVVNPRPASASR